MTSRPTVLILRCCAAHSDWESLVRHLIADFSNVPTEVIVDELSQAKRASELFELGNQDALECAELIVRNRVLIATGLLPSLPGAVACRTTVAKVA